MDEEVFITSAAVHPADVELLSQGVKTRVIYLNTVCCSCFSFTCFSF